jgi:hypothetical protein
LFYAILLAITADMKTANKLVLFKQIAACFLLLFVLFNLNTHKALAVDQACAKFTDISSADVKKCEAETPKQCLSINRTTQKGEKAYDDCLSANALSSNNPLVKALQDIVNFLSAGVGIVVVAMIIVGGIQYSIAGDNQTKVADAKKRIYNAIIALVVFFFIFSFLQWLIPGGLFG